MSEPVQLAKAAREQLAAALSALQTDDNVPDELLEAAEPIAQAMSVLHRIERTSGADLEGRDGALVAVRTALDRLQKVTSTHPAVEIVMEAVAKSLSKVHALARYTPPAAAAAQPVPIAKPKPIPAAQPVPVMAAPAQPVPVQTVPVVQPAPQQPIAQPQPAPFGESAVYPVTQQSRAGTVTMPSTGAPQAGPQYVAPPQQQYVAPPQQQYVAPPQQQYAAPPQQHNPTPAPQPHVAPAPAARAIPADRPSQPRGAMPTVEVELGIHSIANFYKGLGGNDVIEHGGIFVATYKVLKIGTAVTLRILLPGDYEFQASGAVQWTREGGTSEPGYGVRFTQISADGRQLVYRYTRNREPMFYDDL
jgi:Tfp pilus assembly protein PilZ